MNKEQEEALATRRHRIECKNCGAAATVELQFHQVSDSWQPYCDGCHDEMKVTADEVNQHEMGRFGGAFGLVEWLVRELPKALPDGEAPGECVAEWRRCACSRCGGSSG